MPGVAECTVREHVPIPGTVVYTTGEPGQWWGPRFYFARCRCGAAIYWDRVRSEWLAVEEQRDGQYNTQDRQSPL